MEAACWRTAERLQFWDPRISQAFVVMLLGLNYYLEDPYGVEDSINTSFFPYLFPSADSEATLLAQWWYVILGDGGGPSPPLWIQASS